MANPLFNMLGGANPQANNIQQQFDQFKATVNGDPKAMVQSLLNSGQMSQEQFNQLSAMANVLKGSLH